MKTESPKVLSLYAPHEKRFDTPIEMRVQIFPYTSQAHFLLETLGKYQINWQNGNFFESDYSGLLKKDPHKERKIHQARLEDNELVTQVSELQLMRMFFGFNPPAYITTKLIDISLDDERTQQILNGLKYLSKKVSYAYLGEAHKMFSSSIHTYHALLVEKTKLEKLIKTIPKEMFKRSAPNDHLFSTTISAETIIDQSKYDTTPPFSGEITIDEIQNKLLESETPFLILPKNRPHYQLTARQGMETLPPKNLSLIDCFPHKNPSWKQFLEEQKEYSTPPDWLLKNLKRRHRQQSF